jgi:hypothetical protein
VDAVPHPKETHFVVGNTACRRLIRLGWCSRLWMYHFFQSFAQNGRSFFLFSKSVPISASDADYETAFMICAIARIDTLCVVVVVVLVSMQK